MGAELDKNADPKAIGDWFERFGTADSGPGVFCFPYSGSGASMFSRWRNGFQPEVSLFAAKLPGRESRLRESPRENLSALAEEISDVIAESDERPEKICLVGFSLGGLLAFEVARGLRRRQVGVSLLVAGAARAPHGTWSRGKLHRLAEDRFLAKLNEIYGAVPQAVIDNPEMRELVVPMLRGDITMFETYRYAAEPPLDCEILTLLGTEDSAVLPKHVYPWRELGRTFRHRSFRGGHYFVREHQDAVLAAINNRLRRLM